MAEMQVQGLSRGTSVRPHGCKREAPRTNIGMKETVMDYLKRAAKYAEDRGDEHWFSDVYTRLREHFNVHDSVWKALAFLYTDEVADQLEAG